MVAASSTLSPEEAKEQELLNDAKVRLLPAEYGARKNDAVRAAQIFLNSQLEGRDIPTTGNYLDATRAAIKEYQQQVNDKDKENKKDNIPVTGKLDKATIEQMVKDGFDIKTIIEDQKDKDGKVTEKSRVTEAKEDIANFAKHNNGEEFLREGSTGRNVAAWQLEMKNLLTSKLDEAEEKDKPALQKLIDGIKVDGSWSRDDQKAAGVYQAAVGVAHPDGLIGGHTYGKGDVDSFDTMSKNLDAHIDALKGDDKTKAAGEKLEKDLERFERGHRELGLKKELAEINGSALNKAAVQAFLAEAGYEDQLKNGKEKDRNGNDVDGIDGRFGGGVEKAIRAYQEAAGFEKKDITGKLDTNTLDKMKENGFDLKAQREGLSDANKSEAATIDAASGLKGVKQVALDVLTSLAPRGKIVEEKGAVR